jgi:hypothetical protein
VDLQFATMRADGAAQSGGDPPPTAQVRRRRASPASATRLTMPIASANPLGDNAGAGASRRAQLGALVRLAHVSNA